MYTDYNLTFAEVTVSASTYVIAAKTIDLQSTQGSTEGELLLHASPRGCAGVYFRITDNFANPASQANGCEFCLVSLPRTTLTTAVNLENANDLINFGADCTDIPRGTPVYLTALTGGVPANTIKWLQPDPAGDVTKMRFMDTFADSMDETATPTAITADVAATLNWLPTVHASTGLLTASQLALGAEFFAPIHPLLGFTGGGRVKLTAGPPATYEQNLGSGGAGPTPYETVAGYFAANTQRYLTVMAKPTASTSGKFIANITLDAQQGRTFFPSALRVL